METDLIYIFTFAALLFTSIFKLQRKLRQRERWGEREKLNPIERELVHPRIRHQKMCETCVRYER